MTRILTSCGTWPFVFPPNEPRSFASVVNRLHDLGFDDIELGAFEPHPSPMVPRSQWLDIRRIWESLGMKCSGVAIGFGEAKLITDENIDAYMQAFRLNLEFCRALRAPVMRLDTGEPPNVIGSIPGEKDAPKVIEHERAINRVASTWKQCARLASDAGIRLTWEPEPGFALNKPRDIVNVCVAVDHPNFGVMLDTCHAHCMAAVGARQPLGRETLEDGVVGLIKLLRGKINHVHLIDSNGELHDGETSAHPPFGEGVLDFDKIMPALMEACRPEVDTCTIDLCFWPTAWEALEGCKKYLDKLVAKYGQSA